MEHAVAKRSSSAPQVAELISFRVRARATNVDDNYFYLPA